MVHPLNTEPVEPINHTSQQHEWGKAWLLADWAGPRCIPRGAQSNPGYLSVGPGHEPTCRYHPWILFLVTVFCAVTSLRDALHLG